MFRMQRKWTAGLAAGLALLTLVAGCSGGARTATDTSSKSVGSTKPVELTVQTWPGITAETLANVDAEFVAKHPNVKVTLKEGMGKPGVTPDASYLDGVDVVFMGDTQVSSLVNANLLKDLSAVKLPQVNDAAAGVFDEMGKVNGKRYALPVGISPSTIMINPQQITKAGTSVPKADWSWQDFQQALTATKASGVQNQVMLQGILEPVLRAYGGKLYDADRQAFVFDTPEAKQGLAALQAFVKDGLVQSQSGGAVKIGAGPDGGPNNGPAFIALGGSIFIRGGQTQSLPYPKGPKGRPAPVNGTVAAVSVSSPNVEMATEYVKALLNDSAIQLALAKGGIRPVSNDAKALAAWQQAVGDQTAEATEAALPDAYLASPIPNLNTVIQGLLPYLNGNAALDSTVSSLISSLNK